MQNSCPNCKTQVGAPEWKARSTILWANQYGDKRRIFCDVCGQWSDVKTVKGETTVSRIVKQATDTGGK